MASNTVEQIFVELLLNAKGYNKDADEAVKKSEKLEKGLGGTEKQAAKTDKSIAKFTTGLGKAVKGVAGFAAVVAAGTGLLKLADEARKANDELNFLSKNLGMSSGEVKAWQGAAAAMGVRAAAGLDQRGRHRAGVRGARAAHRARRRTAGPQHR